MAVACGETIEEIGFSVIRRASGEHIDKLCGKLAVGFAGNPLVEVRGLTDEPKRKPAVQLLTTRESRAIEYFLSLPVGDAQNWVKDEVESLEDSLEIKFERVDVDENYLGEYFLELYPHPDGEVHLQDETWDILTAMYQLAEDLGMEGSKDSAYDRTLAMTVLFADKDVTDDTLDEALTIASNMLPFSATLNKAVFLPILAR